MSWTEEKVNKLRELWGKGQTASQIAEEYKDCDVLLNQGVPEIKKVRST